MMTLNSLSSPGKLQSGAQRSAQNPKQPQAQPTPQNDVFFGGKHEKHEKKTRQTTLVLDENGLSYEPKPKTLLQKQLNKLIASGANLDQPSERFGKPILHDAALMGDKDVVLKALANGANVNGRDNQGYTPLHWAVQAGNDSIVRLLLDKNADVDAVNFYGNKPFGNF